jgi:acetylornithine deacetylase
MDTVATLAFARELIDIDSTTGREGAAGELLVARLARLGYTVERQPVTDGRFNVFARLDQPQVVLSTHFDCVPPFFPSDVRGDTLYGRGSCDAKGILAAQIAAAERLRAAGERRVGLLFVVGEERGSDGAVLANGRAAGSAFLINGEPTDNRLATATRGILRLRLAARGRAAHSAAPEHGESAIDKLLDALMRMRTLRWPADPVLGETFYTIGLIEGGIAPNVISPAASAEVMFRTVGSADEVLAIARTLEPAVSIEEVLRVPMVRLRPIARCFPSRPTCRCSIAGACRCCSARGRSSSRIPRTSTCRLARWMPLSRATAASRGRVSRQEPGAATRKAASARQL